MPTMCNQRGKEPSQLRTKCCYVIDPTITDDVPRYAKLGRTLSQFRGSGMRDDPSLVMPLVKRIES